MDNITHTLTGICLSRAGLNRITPLALPILVIAANIPDADIVTLLGGSANYLHWHRNLTHSLLAAPILAGFLAAAFRFYLPALPLLPAFFVALTGIASHLLEDLTNNYGVRLLLPFQSTWFSWDLTRVFDFWIWGAFAVAMAGPFLSRLVGSEIGERRAAGGGRGFAIAALLFLVLYNGGRAVVHSRAIAILNAHEYDGAAPLRTAAFPASMNPFDWWGVAETETSYQTFGFTLINNTKPSVSEVVEKASPSDAIAIASATRPFQVMTEFAKYPVYRVVPRPEPEGGVNVTLSDLRFGFISTAILNRQGQVQKSWFQFGVAAPPR